MQKDMIWLYLVKLYNTTKQKLYYTNKSSSDVVCMSVCVSVHGSVDSRRTLTRSVTLGQGPALLLVGWAEEREQASQESKDQ